MEDWIKKCHKCLLFSFIRLFTIKHHLLSFPASKKEEPNNRIRDAVRIIRSYVMNNVELPTVRELMSEMGYKSPRFAAEVIKKLMSKGVLQRNSDARWLRFSTFCKYSLAV